MSVVSTKSFMDERVTDKIEIRSVDFYSFVLAYLLITIRNSDIILIIRD